jgi:molybdenum cofactor synthesis domain-containing protein
VTEEDIPVLLSMGKEHLYLWEKTEDMLHENEGAVILYDICKNDYMRPSEIKEGKIDIFATTEGLFKVDKERLKRINSLGELMIATRHGNFPVKEGEHLAGTRVIPLLIDKDKMNRAKEAAGDTPLMQIKPFHHKKVGIITTGNEVFYGRIQDAFGPVLRQKVSEYPSEVIGQRILSDDPKSITDAIISFIREGAELILCSGGMSVDPDDTTPAAIKATGARIVSYGAPVLPGAMFLLAYYEDKIPILGLPGCVMYSERTIFDLVIPRIFADDPISEEDLAELGHGGLCLKCPECTFPGCGFGK